MFLEAGGGLVALVSQCHLVLVREAAVPGDRVSSERGVMVGEVGGDAVVEDADGEVGGGGVVQFIEGFAGVGEEACVDRLEGLLRFRAFGLERLHFGGTQLVVVRLGFVLCFGLVVLAGCGFGGLDLGVEAGVLGHEIGSFGQGVGHEQLDGGGVGAVGRVLVVLARRARRGVRAAGRCRRSDGCLR